METYFRSFALEGIEILSRGKGGDGRTVEAYAAVFDVPTEIDDQHGHYMEKIHATAFNRTLSNGAASRALVLYNHGRNVVDGKVDSLAQVPLGSPIEVTADSRGLRTVTRYNKSALADSVLEAIKNDDIRAQSFRGGIFRSDPNGKLPRARAGTTLPTVTRMELGLTDYGPTPNPYYTGAAIVAVRSVTEVASAIADLSDEDRQELIRALTTTRLGDPESASDTAIPALVSADSPSGHSGRHALLRLRAEAEFAGVFNGTEAVRGHR